MGHSMAFQHSPEIPWVSLSYSNQKISFFFFKGENSAVDLRYTGIPHSWTNPHFLQDAALVGWCPSCEFFWRCDRLQRTKIHQVTGGFCFRSPPNLDLSALQRCVTQQLQLNKLGDLQNPTEYQHDSLCPFSRPKIRDPDIPFYMAMSIWENGN